MRGRIRIGVVGCGSHANRALLPCLAILPEFDLVAVCDLRREVAERTAARFGVPFVYTDYEKLLDSEPLDALLVSAPPGVQEAVGLRALEWGLHLFLDYPPTLTCTGTQRLMKAAQRSPGKAMVGSLWRHAGAYRKAYELIRRPRFGHVLGLQIRYLCPGAEGKRDWGLDPATQQVRLFLLQQAFPVFDGIRFLGGEIDSVVMVQSDARHGHTAFQMVFTLVEGVSGSATLASRSPGFEASVFVLGDGPAWVEVRNGQHLTYADSEPWLGQGGTADRPLRTWDSGIHFSTGQGISQPGYREGLEHFARTLLEGCAPQPDLADGLAVLRVIEACEQSLGRGERIRIRLSP